MGSSIDSRWLASAVGKASKESMVSLAISWLHIEQDSLSDAVKRDRPWKRGAHLIGNTSTLREICLYSETDSAGADPL